MSAADRRALVERPGVDLSVRRQCALLNLARSGVYRPKPVIEAGDLALMRRIDELHLERPFYGSRRMTFELNKEGRGVNRKRVQRLMRGWGSRRWYRDRAPASPRPVTRSTPTCCAQLVIDRAKPGVGGRHNLHPDGARVSLPRGDHRLGQPRGPGLAAVKHDRSRGSVVEALEEALAGSGSRDIFNTDQGAQFTSDEFTEHAARQPASRSRMDGRGRCDRQHVHRAACGAPEIRGRLPAKATPTAARPSAGIGEWLAFYNRASEHPSVYVIEENRPC